MSAAVINVYRAGDRWFASRWIDGEHNEWEGSTVERLTQELVDKLTPLRVEAEWEAAPWGIE